MIHRLESPAAVLPPAALALAAPCTLAYLVMAALRGGYPSERLVDAWIAGHGGTLTGIGLISRNLARRMEKDGIALSDEVAQIADMVKEADQYARGLARGLVPVELEMGGLTGALERLTTNAERLFGIECTFEKSVAVPVEETTEAMHLYRIAQEAVSNAVRHGKARHVSILLHAGREKVRLRIKDDGVGFTGTPRVDHQSSRERGGMGVRIMHHRARIIGASLEIFGEEGEGTTISCTLRRSGETPARDVEPQLREQLRRRSRNGTASPSDASRARRRDDRQAGE